MSKSADVPRVPLEGGNTKPPLAKKKFVENPCKGWVFTIFNFDEELIKTLVLKCSNVPEIVTYIFGREICPETKKAHLQCYIRCKKKIRWSTIFKGILSDSTHREPAKGDEMKNLIYCSKDGNFVSNKKILPRFLKPHVTLYEWQRWAEMRLLSHTQNNRKILWIYDRVGNIGKSVLVNYLVTQYGAMAVSGHKRHVLAVAHNNPNVPLWIFDIPRTNHNGVSYEALEAIRNGLWMSGFGDATGMTNLDFHPLVVVFCNELPQWSRLSADRWDVWEIVEECGILIPRERPIGYEESDDELSYEFAD